jgi:16S rRNA (guanine527-N7)-methyltransferase
VRALFPEDSSVYRYVDLLASEGVVRGLIGPREAPRLWERHIFNCAAAAPAFPPGARVADLGSGAGLPGIVLALARPDLQLTLIEPLLRRTTFLEEMVAALELTDVVVLRGRAEDVEGGYDVVTSRAVAALPKLLGWSLRLCRPGGLVLAFKGESAQAELDAAQAELTRLRVVSARVDTYAAGSAPPTRVIRIESPTTRRSS